MLSDPRVTETASQLASRTARELSGKPSHWVGKSPTNFHNPWPSFRWHTTLDMFNLFKAVAVDFPKPPKNISSLIPTKKPTWSATESTPVTSIKATWLGHACFLVELPRRGPETALPSRGARVLFDPVFSDRCSPVQFMGPKRFTPPPCSIEDIPEVDAIVISHNHYDHLDTHTIRSLFKRPRMPHIFAPLGNASYFESLDIPSTHTHILDWWDARRIELEVPATTITTTVADSNSKDNNNIADSQTVTVAFDLTCTPAQHFTGRGVLDRFKSLWASWVVEEILPSPSSAFATNAVKPVKVFFGGDTGYRSVKDGQNEDEVPHCPVFKEIGEKFGGFDFAMIPIGAYLPRQFMSSIHCAPQDSVRLFKDIRAKKALGMHWGAWILTTEGLTDPPKQLASECEKIGIEDGAFTVCEIGETKLF